MLPDGRRLGAHLAIGEGMAKGAERAVEIGATALQIFSDNPTAWRRRAEPSREIPAFRARLEAGGIAPLAIHGSYLINPAGGDPDYHDRSVGLLAAELRAARRFGAALVNIHIGSHGGAGVEAGIERLVSAVREALEVENEPEPPAEAEPGSDGPAEPASDAPAVPDPPRTAEPGAPNQGDAAFPLSPPATITLENSAGSGFAIGVDLAELAAIAAALDAAGVPRDRIAFCLDTAHAWGAGFDLSDPGAIDALLEGFDRAIGLDRLPLIHLNDSKSELGSRLDRHEHLGAGRIGEAGFAHLLRHPLLAGATYIIETPGMDEGYDAVNLRRAVALAQGEPLEPLPPGALHLRGSRARAAAPVEPRDVEPADHGAAAGDDVAAAGDDGAAAGEPVVREGVRPSATASS